MVKTRSVLIRVPATTANLGPGYDCLALALDLWNEIEFSISGNSLSIDIEGEGSEFLPRDSTNLIFMCMESLARQTSTILPQGLHIKCTNRIPVSSGLGSSAAAVIAGLLGVRALLDIEISDHDLLKLAFVHEGHCDNISACLFGGLVISILSDTVLYTKKISVKPLRAVISLPDVKISTHHARSVLPESITLKEGIFNLSRIGLLVTSLQEGNYDFLNIAMQDHLHQPYRFGLIPGAEDSIYAALEAGAYGAALSGAGPSVIAFVKNEDREVSNHFVRAFNKAGISSRIFKTFTSEQGAQIQFL